MAVKLGLNNLNFIVKKLPTNASAALETVQEMAASCRLEGATDFVIPTRALSFTAAVKEMEEKGVMMAAGVATQPLPITNSTESAQEAAVSSAFKAQVEYIL